MVGGGVIIEATIVMYLSRQSRKPFLDTYIKVVFGEALLNKCDRMCTCIHNLINNIYIVYREIDKYKK